VGSRPPDMIAKPDNTADPVDPATETLKPHVLKPNGRRASYVPAPLA
jgi:hypothetical protein